MRGTSWIRRNIYFPSEYVPALEDVLPDGEEVEYTTGDELRLAAWFLPGRDDGAPAFLILHGNGGTRADRAPLAVVLAAHGYAVLLTDYRGYGGNPGEPTEEGLASDARAAYAWLRSEPRVDPDRIVFFGESLGSGVAVRLASEAPPAALVLRSPFTSLVDLARVHYPLVPRVVIPDRYPSIDRIGPVASPTLVIVGERDDVVPVAGSLRLFEAASEPKRLVTVPVVDHNDPELLCGSFMVSEIVRFLDEHLPRRA